MTDARGDVPMTTDDRDVSAEVVVDVLGGDAAASLHGFTRTPLGLFA